VVEQRTHKPLVVGSNPSAATKVGLLSDNLEDLPIRELLVMFLGEDGKRRLRLRQMTNDQLFGSYDAELVCRHRSAKGLYEDRRVLRHFRDFLGQYPPSPELAKQFLSQFTNRKTATLARYVNTLKVFLGWYGEKLNYKVKAPKTLPSYVEDSDVDALVEAIRTKATYKHQVARDTLLIHLAANTGLRRTELANLRVGDIHLDQGILIIRAGKGEKDGVVPLNDKISALLSAYIKNMNPEQSLFGLKPSTISGKFEWFSRKAGVKLHCHSLRHRFGTRLIEAGANPEAVRRLMRHESLNVTQKYLSLSDKGLKEAVELLSSPKGTKPAKEEEEEPKVEQTPTWLEEIKLLPVFYKDGWMIVPTARSETGEIEEANGQGK
jgi:integrase